MFEEIIEKAKHIKTPAVSHDPSEAILSSGAIQE
jgi:hypothetical protein